MVLKGRVNEFPLFSILSVESKSFGLTYRILPRAFLRKFSNLDKPMLLFRSYMYPLWIIYQIQKGDNYPASSIRMISVRPLLLILHSPALTENRNAYVHALVVAGVST